MENINTMKREEFWIISLNILMVISICALIVTVITLLKNKEVITKDPLTYGMDKHDFTNCSCIDKQGKYWTSGDGGFYHYDRTDPITYPTLNFTGFGGLNK